MRNLSVTLVVITLLFFGINSLSAQDQAAKPTFKEGDTWQFNVRRSNRQAESTAELLGIYELTYRGGKIKAFSVEGAKKDELNLTDPMDGPAQTLLSWLGSSESRQILRFPMSVGQKWSYQFDSRGAGTRNITRHDVDVVVTGIDQVKTPAGTFKAFKLVGEDGWAFGRSGHRTFSTTYFFSPDTKSLTKLTSERNDGGVGDLELIKFTPGP
jgi:hypothetical protein